MSSIVAGRFASTADAEEVARKLYERGFSVWDVSIMALADEGVMLAAHAKGERRKEATDVLNAGGGKDVAHAEGKWEGGQWTDFGAAARAEPEGEPWPAPVSKGSGDKAGDAKRDPHAKPVAEEAVAVESTGNEDPGSELEHFVDHQVTKNS
ncbi:hypothetical protein [Cupriavidus pampae]|uniref:SPOR domain-containing protein n=1 Tax=Cupriavidus pampae TaxID=659251 RepID=A0ABM8WV50_9BURK|nr:hypothetical protein [Cupriavidus pampae]CAG9171350.1 hypothetical protein LMG32289_02320 [Cupriavidus pampae]